MTTILTHYINGKRHRGHSDRLFDVYDPSLGSVSAQLPLACKQDVDQVLSCAEQAFADWSSTSASKRARILARFVSACNAHSQELALLIAREHGKVISDALGSIQRGLEVLEFACGAPHLLKGEFSHNVSSGMDMYSVREPLGVTVGITPFNFPAMVPMWMFGVSIACGNTFVLKPSEKTPSCALRLAELFSDSGLPDGVFNVINGDAECVHALITDPRTTAVSFVGSSAIAKNVYSTASEAGKRCQALGSAKNHAVVLPDADLETAAKGLIGAAYGSAGERCMATSVAILVDKNNSFADNFADRLVQGAQSIRVGVSTNPQSEMGPLVTKEHLQRVKNYVAMGVSEGGQLLLDGRTIAPDIGDGFFMNPCLFDHVKPDMSIYLDEIFGPVLSLVRVDTLDQAIALTSEHRFGNGTSLYTANGAAAKYFSDRVRVGMVGINVPIPVPLAFHSFGGWKDSVFGDLNMHGVDGVRFFTKLKTVTTRWGATRDANIDLAMPILS